MRWPLLYVGEQLAVVPGLGVAAEFRVRDDEPGLQILWVDTVLAPLMQG